MEQGFPRQAQRSHQAVHHKSSSSHIAGVFQEGQTQEQTSNYRNKSRNSLNTAANTVSQNCLLTNPAFPGSKKISKTFYKDCAEKDVKEINKCRADVD